MANDQTYLLHERYRVLGPLGKGGFGETFIAEDISQAGKKCAIKRLKPITDPVRNAAVMARFRRESSVLRDLGKDSRGRIPEVFEYFEAENKLYLVQELIIGSTLREKVESLGKLSPASTMEILGQLLDLLTFVHGRKMIHRDIKPENVIIREPNHQVVLIDFGLVKEVNNLDSDGNPTTTMVAGTHGYMPPEQVNGKPQYASDLFALGWTGVYLLTGKTPPEFNNDAAQAKTALFGVNLEFIDVIYKAIQLKPADRYGSAEKMLAGIHYAGSRVSRKGRGFINYAGIAFELIGPGSFQMGAELPNEGKTIERPQHRVTIGHSFYLGRYQITQGQWKAIMKHNPSKFLGDDCPVDSISWVDVQSFLTALNATKDGYCYRLPSEAEWEYACRAGSETKYCFGDDIGELHRYAWFADNSDNRTHPVGERASNAWGLHDMHGDVGEWCSDIFHESYEEAPSDGSSWETESSQGGANRVVRGGRWAAQAPLCRSAFRRKCPPNNRGFHDGVRIVAVKLDDQPELLPEQLREHQDPAPERLQSLAEECEPISMSAVAATVVSLLKDAPGRRLNLTQIAHRLNQAFPGQKKLAKRLGRPSMREVLADIPSIRVLNDHKTDPTVCLNSWTERFKRKWSDGLKLLRPKA